MGSPRLRIVPVRDPDGLRRSFGLVSLPDVAPRLGLPRNVSWAYFEQGYRTRPRKFLFLLEERGTGGTAGLVILRPVAGEGHQLELLYCLHPDYRGRSLVVEACKMILSVLLRGKAAPGVAAFVPVSNPTSLRVVKALGMTCVESGARTRWELNPASSRPSLLDRLWTRARWNAMPGLLGRAMGAALSCLF